jgi:outer membrane protein
MKRPALAAAALFASLAALAPQAATAADEEGPFLIRVRGVYLLPANKSDAIPSLGVPADAIHVGDKLIPEVDFTFFLTRNLSAELVLTYPQEHDVTLNGSKIGTATHLPPVLTAQWHFLPDGVFNPYLGAGANLTLFTASDLNVPGVGKLDLAKASVGFSANAGFDVKVLAHWYVNVDVKYVVPLASDVTLDANGTKVSNVQLNPWLFGAGFGYRI